MEGCDHHGLTEFELSVEGLLGPLFRSALRPRSVVASGGCTVLRADSSADMVELVAALISADLSIDSIRRVTS
jgi:hypothetical protein